MSKRIPIEFSEEMSELFYLDYESRKDTYESFDEYMKDMTEYLELKLMQEHYEDELKIINEKLEKIRLKRLESDF